MTRANARTAGRPLPAWITIALLAFCDFGVSDALAFTLGADDKAALMAGQAVVKVAEDPTGDADALIQAAIDLPYAAPRIFAVLLDCKRSLRYVRGLKSCKVLERSADGLSEIREHRSQWQSLFPETVSVFRADYTLDKEIRFQKVRGDLRFLKGVWRLAPIKGGAATRLTYEARVGINAPVPGFMVRDALQSDLAALLQALRVEVGRIQ
ncbi:MAG: hypothetical protein K2X41_01395 [Hyphomicrobium sp.]|nr:hypothetical protein [Hyphomicrobium sp.]